MTLKKIASYSVLIALLILTLVIMVFYRPTALSGDTRYEAVLTGSMEPALPVGSVAVIKPVKASDLVVGDIICYRFSESTLITHRIIEVSDGYFITKGDANEDVDLSAVPSDSVVGKVVLAIPFIGKVGSIVKTPLGFSLLLFLPGILLICFEVKRIVVETKKRNDKVTRPK